MKYFALLRNIHSCLNLVNDDEAESSDEETDALDDGEDDDDNSGDGDDTGEAFLEDVGHRAML